MVEFNLKIALILLLYGLMSCNEIKDAYQNSIDKTFAIDTANNKELFNDFLAGFTSDSIFRNQRIAHPFKSDIGNQPWKKDSLFTPLEFVWAINDKDDSISAEKVLVKFEFNASKTFFFKKLDNKWYLKDIKYDSMNQSRCSCNSIKEDFCQFITRFISDSVFQFERINFPLKKTELDGEGGLHSYFVKQKEYKMVRFWGKNGFVISIANSEQEALSLFCNPQIIIEATGWFYNNIEVHYYFKQVDGKWLLLKIDDMST